MANTFYFHDYETYGTDPARDWPAQFAGIRTDEHFNEIGEPLNIYCRLPGDQLPHPEACLVTGLTPDVVNDKAYCEADFIARIHHELSRPQTCSLGYNSIRFDDEVTRHSLYRNFYDPYGREWQNGCSRWDLIDVTRLCAALRPEGIVWPRREDGSHSFRLEELTRANGIAHDEAHDALSDVRATIALARLLQQKQPRLFHYALNQKHKSKAAGMLNLLTGCPEMVVHVSGMYSPARHCLAIIVPLVQHPTNQNEIVVYDLTVDPEPLLTLDEDDIHRRIFTSTDQLRARGEERIPLKTVRLNRCPILAPVKVMRMADQDRLGVDLERCRAHYQQIFTSPTALKTLRQKLIQVFGRNDQTDCDDPDLMLYSGGFFSNTDKNAMAQVRSSSPEQLSDLILPFQDRRLEEMLFRYRARNWPESLNSDEQDRWQMVRQERIQNGCGGNSLGLEAYLSHLHQLLAAEGSENNRAVLSRLLTYGQRLAAELSLSVV